MQATYLTGYSRMVPVKVKHHEHRRFKRHAASVDHRQQHNTIRVKIVNQRNAEAFALMIPDQAKG
jgi:hypothetical protein